MSVYHTQINFALTATPINTGREKAGSTQNKNGMIGSTVSNANQTAYNQTMKTLDIGSSVRIVCEDDPRCGEVGTVINTEKGASSGATFYLVSLAFDTQWYLACEIKSV